MKKQSYYRFFVSTVMLVIVADRLTKMYVLTFVGNGGQIDLIPSFFSLTMVWNTGVSFGMFSSEHEVMRWLLVIISIAISGLLFFWLTKENNFFMARATGMVIGGALSNALDRVLYSAVADFLDFHLWSLHWPAFNIADSCIFIGVILLCMEQFFSDKSKVKLNLKDE